MFKVSLLPASYRKLLDGKKKKAWNVYKKMNKKVISKKDLAITTALLMLPVKVVGKIFEARWRGQA